MNYGKKILGLVALLGSVVTGSASLWLGSALKQDSGSMGAGFIALLFWFLVLFPAPLLASAIRLLFSGHEKMDGAEMYFLLGAALCLGQSAFALYVGWDYLWGAGFKPGAALVFFAVIGGIASSLALVWRVKI